VVGAVLAAATATSPAGDGATAAPDASPTPAAIDRAVARGLKWLLSEQREDGSFGTTAGETGLALWALRHCGTARDDRASLRAAERLERDLPDGTTYGGALGVCGLLAQDPVRHRDRIRKTLDALARGQCENGQWSYLCGRGRREVGDNSNTQIALLALGAARRRGIDVPDDVMRRSLGFVLSTQNADGGWGYARKQSADSYGSMTAGMLMSAALVASADPPEPEAAARKRGVARA
jgi:squalene cyclase